MPAVLSIIDGPQSGAKCELRVGQRVVLGRGEDADFHILDSWASRAHCLVTYDSEGLHAEDLDTKNGTYLGGRRIQKARLHDGSLLQVGTTTLQVLLRPTQSTVVTLAAPLPRRLARATLYVVAALVLLAVIVGVGVHVFGRRGRSQAEGGKGTGVSWDSPQDDGGKQGVLGIFGGGRKATIAITSEPSGATVCIDDEFRGATPLDGLQVATGEHSLRVQKAGYEVYRRPLRVTGDREEPLHVPLKLVQKGSLMVRSTPDGAAVFLDDEYRGKTPLRIHDLEPHGYVVRVQKPNFADWQEEVTVESNEVTAIETDLSQRHIGYYLEALKKDPTNASHHTELARLYLLEHKIEPCFAHLAKAIDATATGRDTTRQGAYGERLSWLIRKIYFNDYFDYGDAAFVKQTQRRLDALLAEAAGRHPDNSFILGLAKQIYKRAGTPQRLVPIYLKMAEGEPDDLSHYAHAVALLQQAGQHAQAAEVLAKAAKARPNDYRVHLELGRVHLRAKRAGVDGAREKAIQALNAALQHCTDDAAKRRIRRLLGKATE
ncbi:MAG: PEGA domain-containing protein [Planctomycetota bacterium]